MISCLKGEIIDKWQNGARLGVTISLSGIGYDVQIINRDLSALETFKEAILWVHQVQKEDGSCLIGFFNKEDRNFFRKLININGIGPQLAISLLEKNHAIELIEAIRNKEIEKLKACPGVGKRTAERLIIELGDKLYDLTAKQSENIHKKDISEVSNINIQLANEVKGALINLDYGKLEIDKALQGVELDYQSKEPDNKNKSRIFDNLDFESLLRKTLLILNK